MLQRLLLRWKHSRHKTLTLLTATIWICITHTLLKRHVTQNSRTAVHEAIDRWHRSDTTVPKLFSDPQWNGYPDNLLFEWQDVKEETDDVTALGAKLARQI